MRNCVPCWRKKLNISDLMKKLEEFYPLNTQMSWDNSGLQIGDLNSEVKKVHICLDIEEFQINRAIEYGCNTIITHHPLFMSGIKSIEKSGFYYKVIKKALDYKITILSYHTPFDTSVFGMRNFFLSEYAIGEIKNLAVEEGQNFGIVFDVQDVKIKEIIGILSKNFSKYGYDNPSNYMTLYGEDEKVIKRIGYLGGSGASFIDYAILNDVELYLTGDIKYHDAQHAYRNGLSILDLTHGMSEIHFVDIMAKKISDIGLQVSKDYFTFDKLNIDL